MEPRVRARGSGRDAPVAARGETRAAADGDMMTVRPAARGETRAAFAAAGRMGGDLELDDPVPRTAAARPRADSRRRGGVRVGPAANRADRPGQRDRRGLPGHHGPGGPRHRPRPRLPRQLRRAARRSPDSDRAEARSAGRVHPRGGGVPRGHPARAGRGGRAAGGVRGGVHDRGGAARRRGGRARHLRSPRHAALPGLQRPHVLQPDERVRGVRGDGCAPTASR